ncbi:hypothetical protein DFH09DRAFT_1080841 [Mycena vulgaris]|nr:hypothetical protein DFH09DRAFT_1080841 [Mycena vulgaris]
MLPTIARNGIPALPDRIMLEDAQLCNGGSVLRVVACNVAPKWLNIPSFVSTSGRSIYIFEGSLACRRVWRQSKSFSALESGSALSVELNLPKHRTVLALIEFTVKIAQGILEAQKVFSSKEPTGTTNLLAAGITRAAELQRVLDSLGKHSKFLQTVLALGLVASEVNSIVKAVFASMDQIYKDITDVLACITDVQQFVKSAQLKHPMEEVHPILRATVNFITQYST